MNEGVESSNGGADDSLSASPISMQLGSSTESTSFSAATGEALGDSVLASHFVNFRRFVKSNATLRLIPGIEGMNRRKVPALSVVRSSQRIAATAQPSLSS